MTTPSATVLNDRHLPPLSGAVLQVGPLLPALQTEITAEFAARRLPDDGTRAAFLAQFGAGIRLAVTSGKVGVDAALIDALPNLAAIVNFGVGYDTTDVGAARARGIGVSNTPDVLTDCVADTALALLLDVFRRITVADNFLRAGSWSAGNFPLATRFSGTRIGIVGLGRIGGAIATRLEGFGCTISYHNRNAVPGSPYAYAASITELAAGCDALVVAAAGGPDSERIITAEVLTALGPRGYLVNIARGSVVDEPALVDALLAGRIAGAGLDVFADEPRVPAALLGLKNVVLLPHIASGTHETRRAMADLTIENMRSFQADGTLVTPV
ncbi:2-hydroxyacid dehydrogenase [Cryobacterium arcticum]|uniref:2-hydroxyacid dehydrogenase n=1 Tax=Cryobacterium arcticum TaxID=670052 RepID=UPI0020070106|nr:2-hydroxyacid dehydrogenase [Cryobacterium arcticum]